MLQIPWIFPCVSCLGSAKAVQCPRPRPKIGDKNQQFPSYSPVCPQGQALRMAADKCITNTGIHNTGNKEFKYTIFILILGIGLELAYSVELRLMWGISANVNHNGTLPYATLFKCPYRQIFFNEVLKT